MNGVTTVESRLVSTRISGPFFSWLDRSWCSGPATDQDLPPGLNFALGWLGYLGYELKRESGGSALESLLPGASLIRSSRAVVFDHKARCGVPSGGSRRGRPAMVQKRRPPDRPPACRCQAPSNGLPALQFGATDTAGAYLRKVAAAQNEITQGNSYEVCLTTQIFSNLDKGIDPWEFYRRLRRASPAPLASLVQLGPVTIASSSPERFLSITADGRVRAEPIKGTRRRDASPKADRRLKHATWRLTQQCTNL